MTMPCDPTFAQHASAFAFGDTVHRLTHAIAAAGMQLFAVIDHAANAREAGLSMPASTVLIYGKAAGGTPVMLASPQCALDLPLRVLVHDIAGATLIAFHPVAPMLIAAGIEPLLADRLSPAQALLLKAIAQ